ncbi:MULTISPECIES: acyl carrier protein [Actinomadura]|jgi:acyl carrier protein|uniref:Acyl carrier protein n=1 Tax=Actinomadura bangladeshensis TaxID=453573 RepID=A0A4V2XL99_9ACTN|nr:MULTISPECIES: acyl carrier protein [Actinomadura]NEA29069.1 acyl carrier protein [Actinomadura bangladeshensis]NVI88767.1 acyl carrier protein [Actinomadura sp. BRA 177]TDC09636.1 acyl carrier protein [Actinomadura bangladeshensis]CNE37770.1 meromycolate extension acyl carrier protein AcpM [Mycobacterium tuberculosis]
MAEVATEQQILDGLAEIIDDIVGIDKSEVTPEKNFIDDLDIDSLSMVEIAVAAQDQFGVEIPDDELRNLKTVKDVINFVQNLQTTAKS